MPRIEIIEKDETSAGAYSEMTDVVYIPGFVDTDINNNPNLWREDEYIGIRMNDPVLFTTVKDFESLCGKQPAVFGDDQRYVDLATNSPLTYDGFDSHAIPASGVMFKKGQADPAYIMAKELLSAGLNVLFERVNSDVGDYELLETKPADWDVKYANYYGKGSQYVSIKSTVPPALWFKKVDTATETVDEDKIYGLASTDENDNFIGFTALIAGNDYDTTTKEFLTTADVYVHTGVHYYAADADVSTINYTDITYVVRDSGATKKINQYTLSAPTVNWNTSFQNYYEYVQDAITPVASSAQVPDFEANKYYKKVSPFTIKNMYRALDGIFEAGNIEGLVDKGNYSLKYLTSGGYPVYEYNSNSLVNKMIALAVERGDCVAIIDHTDNIDRESNIATVGNLYKTVKEDTSFSANGDFGTMFTPWCTYTRVTSDKKRSNSGIEEIVASTPVRLPASYAYLMALADSIRTNANWLAIAGSARGVVLNLASDGVTTKIPNGVADAMQPRDSVAVNAITNIKPYGYTIWGNRTLKDNSKGNLTATSFLNTRNLISDVKKLVYRVARQLTFEQNTDILWTNFKALISPTLDRMMTGYGISGYKILKDDAHEKASEKATICAKVVLYPVYAVEDFYITIVLKDDEVSVE